MTSLWSQRRSTFAAKIRLSVRGQHPYTGHIGGWAIAVAVVLVAINIGWTAWVIGRAGTGISGPAQRRQAWTGIMVAAWIIGYAATAPLYHARVSHPVWGRTRPARRC